MMYAYRSHEYVSFTAIFNVHFFPSLFWLSLYFLFKCGFINSFRHKEIVIWMHFFFFPFFFNYYYWLFAVSINELNNNNEKKKVFHLLPLLISLIPVEKWKHLEKQRRKICVIPLGILFNDSFGVGNEKKLKRNNNLGTDLCSNYICIIDFNILSRLKNMLHN